MYLIINVNLLWKWVSEVISLRYLRGMIFNTIAINFNKHQIFVTFSSFYNIVKKEMQPFFYFEIVKCFAY